MIKIRRRLDVNKKVDAFSVNGMVDAIEAVINKIAVTRSAIDEPSADYLMYDGSSLYLKTIEGDTFEITMTEV